jgi:hypothetical protein
VKFLQLTVIENGTTDKQDAAVREGILECASLEQAIEVTGRHPRSANSENSESLSIMRHRVRRRGMNANSKRRLKQ